MKRPKFSWPNTDTSVGTLFFAQALDAFVDEQSYEGFRAYALDSLERLREALILVEDVRLKRVNKAALIPVIDEIKWSLSNDEGAKSIAKNEIEYFIEGKNLTEDLFKLQSLISMILSRIEKKYCDVIKDQVVSCIVNPNQRSNLLKATGFLVSHLLNAGYSRAFIKEYANIRFFSENMRKTGPAVVGAFIDSISKKRGKYGVVCKVEPSTASLLKSFEDFTVEPVDALPAHAQAAIKDWPNYKRVDQFILEAPVAADPFRAVDHVHEKLSRIKALLVLPAKRPDVEWGNLFYAYSYRSSVGRVIQRSELSLHTPISGPLVGRRLRQITNVPKQINRDFDDISKERLLSAVSTAAVALEAGSLETRLISLWSAFEVLLSDPPENDARITHYVKHMTPCITWKYHRRIFSAVHDQLAVLLKRKLKNLLDDVAGPKTSNQHTRFAKLIVLPEYEDKRKLLLGILSDNPLALHRLYRLYKFYGTPSACASTMADHQKRVEWQIHRIYRTRNNLVHAGRSPHYIDSLILNTIEYFRDSVITISRFRRLKSNCRNVDQIVAEIGFESEILNKKLRNNKPDVFTEKLAQEVFGSG